MRETTIAGFLRGEIPPGVLDAEATSSVDILDSVRTNLRITDMDAPFAVTSGMLLRCCQAVAHHELAGSSLRVIAFAIIASSAFEWADEIVGEVLHDWSAEEVNYPLTVVNMAKFESWLLNPESYPEKPSSGGSHRQGRPISQLSKVTDT